MMSASGSKAGAWRRSVAAIAATGILCGTLMGTALAQGTEGSTKRDAARQLAREGFAALDRNELEVAEQKLTSAIALHPAPTLYLARGRARLPRGRLVAASQDFSSASAFPVSEGESAAYRRARDEAAHALAALKERVPSLTIEVAGAAPAQLRINGVPWPVDRIGVAQLLDPGAYRVEALGAEGRSDMALVKLEEGQRRVVQLSLMAPAAEAAQLAPQTAEPRSLADKGAASRAIAPPSPQAARGDTSRATSLTPAVWAGIGVTTALTVAAIVTGVRAQDMRSTYLDENRPEAPMARKEELRSEARTMAWINTALVGAAVAAGGTTLYVWLSQPDANSGQTERAYGATARMTF
jgi:hypothetical protein